MRLLALLVVALLGSACIAAPPLGGPLDVRRAPPATPTPTERFGGALPGARDTLPSLFGPPEVVPTPEVSAYRDDVDVRELYRNLAAYADMPLRYRGDVWTVIEQNELLFVQVRVAFGAGPDDWRAIVVMFPLYRMSIDVTHLREGTEVVVWGRVRTMLQFTDDHGEIVEQPLLLGDRLEIVE